MKSFILQIATILFSLLALSSCGNEAVMNDITPPGNGNTIKSVSIKVTDFQYEDATRSFVDITDWGVNFYWDDSDTVGIFPTAGSQVYFAMDAGSGSDSATFNGGGWALKSNSEYAAYYPYNILNRHVDRVSVNYEGQKQIYNDKTYHIGDYDYMASRLTPTTDDQVYFEMNHMGCLVMLKFELDAYKCLTKVTLKANDNIFTARGYIDMTAWEPQITPQRTFSTLSVDLEDFYVDESGIATIYFMMAPVNLWGQTLEFILTDEGGQSLKYVADGKNFSAGMAYAYFLTGGEYVEIPPSPVYVDLGLPSGTLWADRNVGANSPDEYGNLFAWGETVQKELEQYTPEHWNRIDYSTLPLEYDAAYVNMGADWRTPTGEEMSELLEYCTRRWVCRESGIYGFIFRGPNGNSIFFPAAGYAQYNPSYDWPLHMSSCIYHGNNGCGYYWTSTGGMFGFSKDWVGMLSDQGGYRGCSVRAVVR